jgi:TolB protein
MWSTSDAFHFVWKKVSVLAKLFGGQVTINVPSCSPDSRRLAFVSYKLID